MSWRFQLAIFEGYRNYKTNIRNGSKVATRKKSAKNTCFSNFKLNFFFEILNFFENFFFQNVLSSYFISVSQCTGALRAVKTPVASLFEYHVSHTHGAFFKNRTMLSLWHKTARFGKLNTPQNKVFFLKKNTVEILKNLTFCVTILFHGSLLMGFAV